MTNVMLSRIIFHALITNVTWHTVNTEMKLDSLLTESYEKEASLTTNHMRKRCVFYMLDDQ